jgi:hypothetical protein
MALFASNHPRHGADVCLSSTDHPRDIFNFSLAHAERQVVADTNDRNGGVAHQA